MYTKKHLDMANKTGKYNGVFVPMVTPIDSDFKIDGNAVALLMKTFTISGVSAFLMGTTGESTSLSAGQKEQLVKYALENRGNEQTKVLVGVSSNCLQNSINDANKYAAWGVDAVVAHLPYYYPMSPEKMIRYFTRLADNIDCNLILYNNPATVKMSIPLEVADELSRHGNIVGFKDSERGEERLDKALALWKQRPDFVFLLGWAAKSAYAVLKGCHGLVPSTGNLAPSLYQKLYLAAKSGDKEKAGKFQEQTNAISEVYQKDRNISESIPALKIIMSEYGLCQPYVMPPMYQPSNGEIDQLKLEILALWPKNDQ
jgi:4-hydroxy-tetrahydrodipicolinate synthase